MSGTDLLGLTLVNSPVLVSLIAYVVDGVMT